MVFHTFLAFLLSFSFFCTSWFHHHVSRQLAVLTFPNVSPRSILAMLRIFSATLPVFLSTKYSAFDHFHFEFALYFRVFQLPPFYSLQWFWCFPPICLDDYRTAYYSVLFHYTFTDNNLCIHHLLDSSSPHHNVIKLRLPLLWVTLCAGFFTK